MISRIMDLTAEFNANNRVRLDLSEWEIVTFQIISPSAAIDFTGTNDGGEETGTLNPNAASSGNFSTIQAINLATGTAVTATSGSGLYKMTISCKYIQLFGVGVTVQELIAFVNKPY